MADFDLTQTDAQVQSILNDAQDAQGAGAQTTLTTDYIMLKGTNGRYHKIQKNSFTEACRNVLAGLLVNNDKGTTISQIPAIASGDFGSVTPENLASVLGVWKYIGSAANIDNLTTPGYYIAWSDAFGYYTVKVYKAGNNGIVQEYVSIQELKIRYKTPTGSWVPWKKTPMT
jgi:hypothetical protein